MNVRTTIEEENHHFNQYYCYHLYREREKNHHITHILQNVIVITIIL